MNRKAFTLLELLIVILIIAIIATLAVPQYMDYIERSRAGEAYRFFAALKLAQLEYHLEHGTFASFLNELDMENPSGTYWTYWLIGHGQDGFAVGAVRTARDASPSVAGTETQMYYNFDGTTTWCGNHVGTPPAGRF